MQKVQGQWWRALLFGLLLIIGYKIIDNFSVLLGYLKKLLGILTPFIIGGAIAFFLHTPVKKLQNWFLKSRTPFLRRIALPLALGLVYLLFLSAWYFIIRFLVEAIAKNIAEIISNWDSISARAMEIFNAVHIPDKQGWLNKINVFLSNLLETEVLLKAGNIVGGVASSLVSVFAGLIISIYTILEKESLKSIFKTIMTVLLRPARAGKVLPYIRRLVDLFYSYFSGLAIDAVVVGAISTLFYVVYGAPYPWLLGLVVTIGNVIPFFGPIIATAISTLVTLISMGPLGALWVLVFQLLLGQVDGNLIQPRILGKSVGISPFWVIFAVLFFGGIWGTVGMILGVPLVAAVRMILLSPPGQAENPKA